MRARVYNYETVFDFGKHKGKSLKEVLAKDSRYIGFLYLDNVRRFILDFDVIRQLEGNGFFDNLEFPYYGSGGSIPFRHTNITKEEIIIEFKCRHEDFIKDPESYNEKF